MPLWGEARVSAKGSNTWGCHRSEVHKARHRQSGKVVALKKILMHNSKDEGVGITTFS